MGAQKRKPRGGVLPLSSESEQSVEEQEEEDLHAFLAKGDHDQAFEGLEGCVRDLGLREAGSGVFRILVSWLPTAK